jgi:hypothetical protein
MTPTRIALIVTASVSALIAAGFLALGGLALWGDGERDKDGYFNTDEHHFAASTHALASENLDIDLGGAEEVLDESDLGGVRLQVDSQSDEPVFVGIARTDDVSRYLNDVGHTTVTDFDDDPDETSYSSSAGERRPATPADQAIWAASAQGTGEQTLKWDIEDGDWSIVVMNADGSRGIAADVSAGAKVSFLDELGWSLVGVGTFLVLAAGGLIALAIRRPRNPGGQALIGGPAAAAA